MHSSLAQLGDYDGMSIDPQIMGAANITTRSSFSASRACVRAGKVCQISVDPAKYTMIQIETLTIRQQTTTLWLRQRTASLGAIFGVLSTAPLKHVGIILTEAPTILLANKNRLVGPIDLLAIRPAYCPAYVRLHCLVNCLPHWATATWLGNRPACR
jgi:hypothetical protein